MTEMTALKLEKVKNLLAQGSTLKNAAKKAKIDLGHYYRVKKKLRNKMAENALQNIETQELDATKEINISFMGMDISGDPLVVKDFIIKFMKEYRQP